MGGRKLSGTVFLEDMSVGVCMGRSTMRNEHQIEINDCADCKTKKKWIIQKGRCLKIFVMDT